MILETVKHDAATIENGVIVFISADNLLRTSFDNQVTSNCSIEVYSEVDEFVRHLELLAKTKSEQYTKEVLEKVSKVFYDPEDPNCVVLSQGVLKQLTDKFAEDMTRPPILQVGLPKYPPQTAKTFPWFTQPSAPTNFLSSDWIEEMKHHWTPVSDLKVFPSSHVFQSDLGDGRYHWKSTITLARLLRRTVLESRRPYSLPTEKIRTKDVDVLWSCLINPHTAEFSDPKVEEYRPQLSDSFMDADLSTRTAYEFPMFPGVDDNG